ncbi:MAG: NAD(P)/FAD-dependent oxidoreductase [Candidatus Paceibacterota bacterium]
MSKYKTVIIGAGPAGLRCARILAENRENFILLESRKEIGQKICAGLYGIPGSKWNKTDYFDLPEDVFQKKINRIALIYRRKRREISCGFPLVATIDRKRLSQRMYEKALAAGADIKFGSPVTEIGDGYVISNGEKIFFDYLVGADGANSIVRKKIGFNGPHHLALQYWLDGEADWLEIKFVPNRPGTYYVWSAPHQGRISIGAGGDIELVDVNIIKDDIARYCSEKGFDFSGASLEGAFIGCDYQGYRSGNMFLAGDAAGLASELTGEGIQPAIASGEDIARMIIDAKHDPIMIKRIIKKKKWHEYVAKIRQYRWLAEIETTTLFLLLRLRFLKKKIVKSIA